MVKERKHFHFDNIEDYLRNKKHISTISTHDYGIKSNFQRAAKRFEVKDGHLFYNKRMVIKDKELQIEVIRDFYRGIGNSEHSIAMASPRGKNTTYDNIVQRFFWYNIAAEVSKYIRSCEQCQKRGDLKSPKVELKSIPVPSSVMEQSEAKPIKEKSAQTVSRFLYEIMSRHGCFKIQINDQGREFVNEVLEGNPKMWPQIIEGILFAHRVSRHSSTNYSPFMLMYNREPILPIDVKHSLVKDKSNKQEHREENIDVEQPFNFNFFDALENKVDDIVLLKNNKRFDRKGGKFSQKWLGPVTVVNISEKGVATLKNVLGLTLEKIYNIVQLKTYIQEADDKLKPILVEGPAYFWNHAPDEIVEMILSLSYKIEVDIDAEAEVDNRIYSV
ncbi:uncharacterized protein LOC124813956 [Hydra vulgaris]|uniref:uncharacterized protein LOC124813956 n=1 Tax=Hydra vulgaris TaxID=6087 RepID=UPI001F5E697A|nr:uncharacterized protein LOC124813956 [Hydra vulgaris]